jgi:transcriptional regulator with XRE-family HTH domain
MRYLKGLREARERAVLTQDELGAKAGVAASTISRIENGLQQARIPTIRKIAEALAVSADSLIDWERSGPRTGKAAA